MKLFMIQKTKKILMSSLYKLISSLDKKLYKDISNKIVDEYKISDIEILTDTGYQPITNLYLTKPFENYFIKLENGYVFEGADTHILFDENYNEIFIKDLKIGDKIITDIGISTINHIENKKYEMCMGDLTIDNTNHRFYSNGLLSHNSVTTGIYALWKTLFNIDNNALILSKSGGAGRDLVKKVKDMYLYLPYHLKCGTLKWNQGEVSFDNGSSFKTEAFGPTAGLGSTINTLILDEFAWCPPNDVELFYENIIPTVTTMPNSTVCIISTQNGFNKFYQIWNGAITGKNIYAPFKVDWYQVPNFNPETKQWEKRTEEWKDMMIGVLGSEEAFYYQYGTQFSASDKCLVSREKLVTLRDKSILYKGRENELTITALNPQNLKWDPDYDLSLLKNNYYVILVDLAEGGGNDYTIFHICELVEKDKFKEIGYYRSNKVGLEDVALDFWLIFPQLFSEDHYIISIEWNTYGALFYQYLMQLNETEYRPEYNLRFNYIQEFDLTHIAYYKKGSQEEIDINNRKSNRKEIPGIRFSHSNKVTACMLAKMMIEKDELIINDVVTISELENFEDKNGNGSYAASFGNDDLIMSLIQLPLLKNTSKYKNFVDDFETSKLITNSNVNNSYIDDFYSQNTQFGPFQSPYMETNY